MSRVWVVLDEKDREINQGLLEKYFSTFLTEAELRRDARVGSRQIQSNVQ